MSIGVFLSYAAAFFAAGLVHAENECAVRG
jgi:hypothetical protein